MTSTKEERFKEVVDAMAINSIDAPIPDEFAMNLFQEYINGKINSDDIESMLIEKYTEKLSESK